MQMNTIYQSAFVFAYKLQTYCNIKHRWKLNCIKTNQTNPSCSFFTKYRLQLILELIIDNLKETEHRLKELRKLNNVNEPKLDLFFYLVLVRCPAFVKYFYPISYCQFISKRKQKWLIVVECTTLYDILARAQNNSRQVCSQNDRST